MAFGVDSFGKSGGLCVYWREGISFSLVSYSDHICGDFSENGGRTWRFVGVYGWVDRAQKHNTWALIRDIYQNSPHPMVLGGDFNEILCAEEKSGGALREQRAMDAFREVLDECNMRDLGHDGSWVTWERGNDQTGFIRERLDRFVACPRWCAWFNQAHVTHLTKFRTDHVGIVLDTEARRISKKKSRKKRFRFETCWLLAEGVEDVIRNSWESRTDPVWSKDKFDNLGERIAETEDALKELQNQVRSHSNYAECNRLEGILDDLHEKNEAYWYLRSRGSEIKDGDRNTKYFHHKAGQRRSKNRIKGLKNAEGEWQTGKEMLKKSSSIFMKYWHIVGDDVTRFINNIISGRIPLDSINRINVVLIPKVKEPTCISQFRPIALCNVLYKLASKSVANKLKPLLQGMVTENQSAFVPKRLITDNALIALELFHTMKKRSKSRRGSIAMKLDMSKAYDRVEWGFLRKLLVKLGFAGAWVDTIMAFVTTVRYSFIINGVPSDLVTPSRGLRQGDPISPYLFILVADVLSRMLQTASKRNLIHGVRASRNGPEITHLFFADDNLLFTRATRQECSIIVDILNKYEATSEQKINLEKSEVSFSKGVHLPSRITLSSILGMEMVDNHVKYLGLPTVVGRSKKAIFAFVKDRIWKKVQGWKEKFLSRAGKEVLLKSIIQAIPTYLMGVYRFPEGLIQEIHAMMARFWWGSNDKGRKIHWKNWDTLCQPKCLGAWDFEIWSIWSSKALVKEGILWRVGDGQNINVWTDPWLIDDESRFVTTEARQDLCTKVDEIFDKENHCWDSNKVETIFNERDKRAILTIPLSERMPKDSLSWAWSKDGFYSVKTAYILGKSLALDNFELFWVEIWKAKVTPKLDNYGLDVAAMRFRRNKWVFESVWDSDVALLLRHSRLVTDFGEYTERIYGNTTSPGEPVGSPIWVPPPIDFVKVNVDATITENGWVGLGAIARDDRGRILFSAVCRTRARWEPLVAECKAALFGIKKAREKKLANIILESDSLLLVSKLKKGSFSPAAVGGILEDIVYACTGFSSISWSHVKWEGNFVAHHLARLVSYGSEQLWDNLVPNEISPYVLLDSLSIN
ncbi:uncharacterized protein LOC110726302 [Chenopodium quinoa]|uniref:uncharacterized protein LOC110726302 n=1 Tax=Chenopodium quinoa TaxID=63459 RepID=UPI000B77FEB6|nr:uncharacterized protein LOC110726302 [Chenopodium quinoa]